MMRSYLGIDPGVSGGMAIISHNPGKTGGKTAASVGALFAFAKKTERDIWDFFVDSSAKFSIEKAVIERVNSGVFAGIRKTKIKVCCPECYHDFEHIHEERQQMGVKSAFTFGGSYKLLQAFLMALDIPYEEIAPQKWQAALSCRTGGDKNVSKRKAQQLYPSAKITHGNADALLLATYCLRY